MMRSDVLGDVSVIGRCLVRIINYSSARNCSTDRFVTCCPANELKSHMNNTSNPNPSQPAGEGQPEGSANSQASSQPGRCVLDPLCSAVNEGAHRAKAAAEKTIPKVKAALSGATYWLGYGMSFATVFSYTILTELAPEVLKTGCRDGAQVGRRTAQDVASKLEGQPETDGSGPSSGTDPSAPIAQPGGT
jgi:hypothetical protein